MKKRCFLMGSRIIADNIPELLKEQVERLIEQEGVTEFLVGQRGSFDMVAADTVRKAKERHPWVRLILLKAYRRDGEHQLPGDFDESLYPEGQDKASYRFAIVRANIYAAEHCDLMLFYPAYPWGNTQKMIDRMLRRPKESRAEMIIMQDR